MSQTVSTPHRVIKIDGTLNFRDIGGYIGKDGRRVKWRKAFRSAQLHSLSDTGVASLQDLQIKTVIDLRFDDESKLYPTMVTALPNAEIFTWQDEFKNTPLANLEPNKADVMRRSWRESLDTNDPDLVREAMRSNYPTKLYSHRAIYRTMLLRLMNDDSPVLFHCAAGKDRTGVGAALVLSLLGVDNDQITEDYLLTQELIKGRMETWIAGGATNSDKYQDFQSKLSSQPVEMLKPVFDADPNYIKTLLDYVQETYTNFENYALQQLEMTPADIEKLQEVMLT